MIGLAVAENDRGRLTLRWTMWIIASDLFSLHDWCCLAVAEKKSGLLTSRCPSLIIASEHFSLPEWCCLAESKIEGRSLICSVWMFCWDNLLGWSLGDFCWDVQLGCSVGMIAWRFFFPDWCCPAEHGIRIKMHCGVDSLNVGVACGVLLNGFVERENGGEALWWRSKQALCGILSLLQRRIWVKANFRIMRSPSMLMAIWEHLSRSSFERMFLGFWKKPNVDIEGVILDGNTSIPLLVVISTCRSWFYWSSSFLIVIWAVLSWTWSEAKRTFRDCHFRWWYVYIALDYHVSRANLSSTWSKAKRTRRELQLRCRLFRVFPCPRTGESCQSEESGLEIVAKKLLAPKNTG